MPEDGIPSLNIKAIAKGETSTREDIDDAIQQALLEFNVGRLRDKSIQPFPSRDDDGDGQTFDTDGAFDGPNDLFG